MSAKAKKKVAYFYDVELGNYYMGPGHPMKPHRIRLTHNLILHYGLHNQMEVFRPRLAQSEDMEAFHTEEYIDFLKNITPDNQDAFMKQAKLFSMNKDDCPVFDGLYEYCQRYTGGSIGGAVKLNYSSSDVVINWSGGLHHAKKSEASGFCYVNDIVLAILELLKYHQRVLYVDIDVHHGDGVEEAFLHSDRVMTVSFHKHGNNFFPGTGDIKDTGFAKGLGYSLNVPLANGITDSTYWALFKPVMAKVMEVYRPEAIVFQSGADSLGGDMLGVFNLTIEGHAKCLMFMESFNIPLLVLGGGGYTINNVARCWAYETGRILGTELSDQVPDGEFKAYFAPDYRLHIPPTKQDNQNSQAKLEEIRNILLQNLSKLRHAPSVGFHPRVPDTIRHDGFESNRPGMSRLGMLSSLLR